MVIGPTMAGKTALLHRLSRGEFREPARQTIGLDFFMLDGQIENVRRSFKPGPQFGTKIFTAGRPKVYCWELCGLPRFIKLHKKYIPRFSEAVLFCFDSSSVENFTELNQWLELVLSLVSPDTPMLIAALQSDKQSAVSQDDIQALATQHRIPWLRVSAKSGYNLSQLEGWLRQPRLLAAVPLSSAPPLAPIAEIELPPYERPQEKFAHLTSIKADLLHLLDDYCFRTDLIGCKRIRVDRPQAGQVATLYRQLKGDQFASLDDISLALARCDTCPQLAKLGMAIEALAPSIELAELAFP